MGLTSWVFVLFLIALLLIHWLSPSRFRDLILIAAGLFFYGYTALEQLPVILMMMVITYMVGRQIDRYRAQAGTAKKVQKNIKRMMVTGVIFLVAALTYYKYSALLVKTWNTVTAKIQLAPVPNPGIITPLAISFVTFQFIHYLIDKYKGKIEGSSIREFMLYTMFFPTMMAGPIKRYQPFAAQINQKPFALPAFGSGLSRVLIGLGKKIILADTFALWGDKLLNPQMNSGLMLLVAVYCYSMKIYFDFSAYSDIAIGISKMLGYEIPENFNWPYLAANISNFWRRWHISLSDWIKDYIFIPLGGSRVSYPRHFVNSVITMALCGLWHGASWTFLIWGIWHGIGQGVYSIYRRTGLFAPLREHKLWKLAGWFVTFNFVSFGWIFFAAGSFHDALMIFSRIFSIR